MPDSTQLVVNGLKRTLEVDPGTPLLWVLRDTLGLTGTKYGCGIGLCGSCTVHADGRPVRSCVSSLREVTGKRITTIEGLSRDGDHPLQKAWVAASVPQCGYCQPGQIMRAAALLAERPDPGEAEVREVMKENLCRCGTYMRIVRAVLAAARERR